MDDVAVRAHRIREGGVTQRGVVEDHPFAVQPQAAHPLRKVIEAEAQLGRVALVAEDLGDTHVSLQHAGKQHRRCLELIAVIADVVDDRGARSDEIAEPAAVILALERIAPVLEARIE